MAPRFLPFIGLSAVILLYLLTLATGSSNSLSEYFWWIIAAASILILVLLAAACFAGALLPRAEDAPPALFFEFEFLEPCAIVYYRSFLMWEKIRISSTG